MIWWLCVQDPDVAKFISGVFFPITSAEACEKSSRWIWKEICVIIGVCVPDHDDMTAVKVALNLNTTNQHVVKYPRLNFTIQIHVYETLLMIHCMVNNPVFNSISIIWQRPVHLSTFSLSFILSDTPHYIFFSKPLAAFPHSHCRNNGQQKRCYWNLSFI